MKSQVYVAVDIGATGIKMVSASFREGRLEIQEIYSADNRPIVKNGREYADVAYMLSIIRKGLSHFSDRFECICLGIDTYGNGYGILDESGRLIQEPHYYRDHRIDEIMEQVHLHFTDRELYEQTGNFPVMTRGLFHLYRDVLEGSRGILEGHCLLPLPNLLEYLITGKKGSEKTIASVLYLLDQTGETWNFRTFQTLGIPCKIFGPLEEPGQYRGRIQNGFSKDERLNEIPVVSVIGHDTESALLAASGLDDGKVFVSLGTSFIFGTRVKAPVVTERTYKTRFKNMRGGFGTYSLCKDFPGFWILERCMERWRQKIPDLDYQMVCTAAAEAEKSETFINISDDRFRVSEADLDKVIYDYCIQTGQKPVEGVGPVSRCLFESYALYLRWNLEQLQEITGKRYNGMTAVNGGVKNKFLMQLLADVLEIPIMAGSPLASACGNLLMQLYAAGIVRTGKELEEAAAVSWIPRIYECKDSKGWKQRLEQIKQKDLFKEEG